MRMIVL